MKSFLIIGMGTLGHHLCRELCQNNDVMVADLRAEAVEDVLRDVVSAKVADCTNIEVLKSFGVEDFDACFVCVGNHFQACLEITDLLKELGASTIYSEADRDVEEKFLLRNGADHVIYPERDIARRIAGTESSKSIFDCINLSDDYAVFEIEVLKRWIGKTIKDIDFRNKYQLNILAFKRGDKVVPIFRNDYVFNENEHIMVMGSHANIRRLIR